jgi:hypothetical protein
MLASLSPGHLAHGEGEYLSTLVRDEKAVRRYLRRGLPLIGIAMIPLVTGLLSGTYCMWTLAARTSVNMSSALCRRFGLHSRNFGARIQGQIFKAEQYLPFLSF